MPRALSNLVAAVLAACQPTAKTERDPYDLPAGAICAPDGGWPVETPFNDLLNHLAAGAVDEAGLAELDAVLDWAREQNGPWANRTDGPWRAADGVNFVADADAVEIPLLSVPDLVLDETGAHWLIGVSGDLDALAAAAAAGEPMSAGVVGLCGLVAYRVEPDGAVSAQALEITGDVPACVVDPDVRRGPDGRWHMLFLGIRAEEACADAIDPASVPAPHHLYDAVSDDLQSWALVGEAAQVEGAGVDPTTWCDGDPCGAWMSAGLWSEDGGLHFEADTDIHFEIDPDTPDAVALEGGWRVYTGERGVPATLWSTDGRSFAVDGTLEVAIHTAAVDNDGVVIGYR